VRFFFSFLSFIFSFLRMAINSKVTLKVSDGHVEFYSVIVEEDL